MNEEPNPAGTALRRFKDPNYRNLAESLADIRGAIDRIDEQIVALLAERGRYVKDAARFKRDAFQVSAPQRQQQVFDRVVRLAHEQGAYPEVVEACYRTMVAGFIAREQADFAEMEPVDPAKATPGVSR
jgi:isochorismate pyruvate lyase